MTIGSGFLVQARDLKLVGGIILVGGLAIFSAIFLAAAAGSGSLQLKERSALLIVLEVILEGLDCLGRAWKAFAHALVGNLTLSSSHHYTLYKEQKRFQFFCAASRRRAI